MFKRLLVPVDFGEIENDVVRVARRLSAQGALMRLLHVVSEEIRSIAGDEENYERFVTWAQARMDALARRHADETKFRTETELREGNVYREIVDHCGQFEPDAVVIGSHGRRGLERLLLGSVAEKMLRGVTLPVCIVKTPVSDVGTFSNVALATDLESVSEAATDVFGTLLDATMAHGTILHGFATPPWETTLHSDEARAVHGDTASISEHVTSWAKKSREDRQMRLRATAERIRADGRGLSTELLDGEPWAAIAEYTKTHDTQLLIVGTHHFVGLQRLVLGSVAEKIVRTVECPVLVVPSKP